MANVPEMADNEKDHPELLAGCVSRTTQKFLWSSFCLIGLLSTVLGCSKTELEPMDGQESEQIMPEIAKLNYLRRRSGMSQSREAGRSKTHTPQQRLPGDRTLSSTTLRSPASVWKQRLKHNLMTSHVGHGDQATGVLDVGEKGVDISISESIDVVVRR